jgi:hypothetical protein
VGLHFSRDAATSLNLTDVSTRVGVGTRSTERAKAPPITTEGKDIRRPAQRSRSRYPPMTSSAAGEGKDDSKGSEEGEDDGDDGK